MEPEKDQEKEQQEEETKKNPEENKEEEKEEEKKENKKENSNKNKKEKINLILAIDEENNICVDCDKKNPTKISINNGVIICESCAKQHEELGYAISYIKDIEDDFDEYLLNFLVFGSNSKFKRFLLSEGVDASLPIKKNI